MNPCAIEVCRKFFSEKRFAWAGVVFPPHTWVTRILHLDYPEVPAALPGSPRGSGLERPRAVHRTCRAAHQWFPPRSPPASPLDSLGVSASATLSVPRSRRRSPRGWALELYPAAPELRPRIPRALSPMGSIPRQLIGDAAICRFAQVPSIPHLGYP